MRAAKPGLSFQGVYSKKHALFWVAALAPFADWIKLFEWGVPYKEKHKFQLVAR